MGLIFLVVKSVKYSGFLRRVTIFEQLAAGGVTIRVVGGVDGVGGATVLRTRGLGGKCLIQALPQVGCVQCAEGSNHVGWRGQLVGGLRLGQFGHGRMPSNGCKSNLVRICARRLRHRSFFGKS